MAKSKLGRPHQRLVQLLFLASASSAATIISIGDTSLSLSNFQLVTQLSVPLGCLLAYNNPISGCTAKDFKEGSTCSNSCRRGLSRMQTNLQDACEAVQVQTNTLLGQALAGNLINLLCPSTGAQPTSSAPPVQPSSASVVQPSSTAVIPPPPPPPPPPPVTTTAQTIPPPATTSVVIPPSSPPPANPPSSTAAPPVSQLPPPPPPLPALPTTVVTSTATSDAAPQSTSAETKKPEVNPLDALLMSGDSTASFKASRGVMYILCLLWASILAFAA